LFTGCNLHIRRKSGRGRFTASTGLLHPGGRDPFYTIFQGAFMSTNAQPEVGTIGWIDVTVPDAERLRDFYCNVVGWKAAPVPMGGYDDFCMNLPQSGKTVAGVCHARGPNADLPSAWLVYITVGDLDQSMARCVELGGQVLGSVREMGGQGRLCIIRDPSGAAAALFEPARG
jgi:predicted enzyme related to lactoylglutathione lyase